MRTAWNRRWPRLLVVPAMILTLAVGPSSAAAQTDPEQELAERHAPVMRLKAQEAECDANGEQYAPAAADIVLDNPQILLRQVGTGNPVITAGPGPGDLFDLGEGFYLDFPGNALDPDCIYERDFRRYNRDRPAVVYAHIVGQEDRPDRLALQYWFFYYYNDYNNLHEGDWEGIQLLFEVGTVEEALGTDPVSIGYSQHFGGERADWGGDKLERDGGHPIVYPAVGSHASYFTSDLYLGRSGSQGFGCDNTQGPFTTLEPEVVVLPHTVDDPADPLAWLRFEGRWGERQSGPFDGPTGPITKDRWTQPIDWHDDLRGSSVIVPGGENSSTPVVNSFCGIVEWGSAQVITAQESPLTLAAMVAGAALVGLLVFRQTEWDLLAPTPIVRRRKLGELLRAAGRLYRRHPGRFIEIGLVYLPVALILSLLTLAVDRLSQADGILASIAVLIIGGMVWLSGLFVLMAVTAAVAAVMVGPERGETIDGVEGYRRMFKRLGHLVAGFAQIVVTVGLLAITVVGIPWAIRRLVRYQLFAPVTMVEGLAPRQALARSAELVTGRWFHTAFVGLVLGGAVSLANGVTGITMLLLLPVVPLWLFSLLVSVTSALIAPFSAIGTVLLYGDARAERENEPAAEPIVDQHELTAT